jgi:Tripartite tricarboxylate transporter TctB family
MISRRWLEVATGALTGAFAIAIIVSSVGIGSGWSAGGVESGTFPLIAGVLVLAGSLVNIARGLVDRDAIIVRRDELRRLAGLFLPAVAFVAAIPLAGIYVAAAGYLVWALGAQRRLALWRTGLIVAGTLATLYFLFEQTFQVVLPHGWLGQSLGL